MRKVRFGIVGCGAVANIHAKAIQNIDSAELAAAYSRTTSCLNDFCSAHGCPGYSNLDEFLQKTDVDIVTICSPSGAHAEPACKAAESHKHVIVEKPIDVTLERAHEIIDCCEKSNVLLGVVFQSRFSDASRLLKNAVEKQLFGQLTLGSAYVKWYRSQEYYDSGEWRGTIALDGGGALMNQSIHAIDLLQWFMGDVDSVQAYTATLAHDNIEVEDTAAAILKFRNGALGVIEGSTAAYPGYDKRIEISGEKGTVVLTEDRISEWSFDGPTALDDTAKGLQSDKAASSGAADPMGIDFSGHKAQFEDFIDAMKNGKRPLVDGNEGRKALEIVLAIYRSALEGKRVDLPLA